MGISTAHLTGCIIHWWATYHPICASPQSRRAGIAPSYRAQLTVQHHSSPSRAPGSHAWPASWLTGLHTCAHRNQSKQVISSSLQLCLICWFFLMANFCFRPRICLGSVVSADRASSPKDLCVDIGDWFFQLSYKNFMNTSVILFPGVFFLHLWNSGCILPAWGSLFFYMPPHRVIPWIQSCFLQKLQDK